MTDLAEDFRRRVAPVSLRLWPGLDNPAWASSGAARLFGDRLTVALDPARVARKVQPESAQALRGKFLVNGLDALPATPVSALYTHRDMEDIARYGGDWRSTRLGQWLLACLAAGMPPLVRGRLITDEAGIEAYYRSYLTMFESMRDIGYRYDGDDHMCFGIGSEGGFLLVRRGTHRLAAAQIPVHAVGKINDLFTGRAFADAACRKAPMLSVPEALLSAVKSAALS